MNYCKQCGQEYEAKRSTSQFCSDGCRKQNSRVSVTETIEESPLSVTIGFPEVSVTSIAEEVMGADYTPTDEETLTLHEQNCEKRGVNKCLREWVPIYDLPPHTVNRVPIPGDADYTGVWHG